MSATNASTPIPGSEWRRQVAALASPAEDAGRSAVRLGEEVRMGPVEELKQLIHRKLVEKVKPEGIGKLPEAVRRTEVRAAIERLLETLDARSRKSVKSAGAPVKRRASKRRKV